MNEQLFAEFVSKIGVMKPNTVNEDNEKQKTQLMSLLQNPEYVAEEKIDGCRYLSIDSRFVSTDGVEKTQNYPHLHEFLTSLNFGNLILDGEINYPGKTSQFVTRVSGASPQNAISFQEEIGYIHYTIWDILRTPKGTWLVNEPLSKRRQYLEHFYNTFIKGTSLEKYIHLVPHITEGKKEFYEEIILSGGEGVVLKKLSSIYFMGKNPKWQWMKLKQQDTADLFITGYDPPTIAYNGKNVEDWPYWMEVAGIYRPVTENYYKGYIGSIQLSAYVDGNPMQICTCSGIDKTLRENISLNKEAYINRVVKITFMEKTEAGIPRHPRFEGFHESKQAHECTWVLE